MTQPERSRMSMPGYGLSTDETGMLDWAWVQTHMTNARSYWVSTVTPDGKPHAAPVWGVWLDDVLYFSTGRTSRKGRNLAHNPQVVVHLESGDEVAIFEGKVEEVPPADVPPRFFAAYTAKYNFDPTDSIQTDPNRVLYRLVPHKALTWLENDFPKTATQWRFR